MDPVAEVYTLHARPPKHYGLMSSSCHEGVGRVTRGIDDLCSRDAKGGLQGPAEDYRRIKSSSPASVGEAGSVSVTWSVDTRRR